MLWGVKARHLARGGKRPWDLVCAVEGLAAAERRIESQDDC